MADMTDDGFYVDDETPEEFEAAWREGERGVTKGPRDLNQRAMAIVEQAVEQFDRAATPVEFQTTSVLNRTQSWVVRIGDVADDVRTLRTHGGVSATA